MWGGSPPSVEDFAEWLSRLSHVARVSPHLTHHTKTAIYLPHTFIMCVVSKAMSGTPALGGQISKGNVQITFPTVFAKKYAKAGRKLALYPSIVRPIPHPPVGEDFQSQWHQQKMRDAHYMARAKVQSTVNSAARAGVSAHGLYDYPQPQLAQRNFANPSFGDTQPYSARQDYRQAPFHIADALSLDSFANMPRSGSGLVGGVLRSPQGQAYGKAKLMARVGQLNAISAAKQEFLGAMPMDGIAGAPPSMAPVQGQTQEVPRGALGAVSETVAIELNLQLQQIIDALMSGQPKQGDMPGSASSEALSRFTYTDATRALQLLFRIAPSASADELEDTMSKVDIIVKLLDSLLDPDFVDQQPEDAQVPLTLQILFDKVRKYLVIMMAPENINRSPAERMAISKNAVITLQFSKALRAPDLSKLATEAPRAAQRADAMDAEGRDEDDFNGPQPSREFTQAFSAGDDETFDPDERQRFGFATGSYFGEQVREDGNAVFEAPGAQAVAASEVRRRAGPYVDLNARPPARESGAVARAADRTRGIAAAEAAGVRGYYDRDTQGFNVGIPGSDLSTTTRRHRPAAAADADVEEDIVPPSFRRRAVPDTIQHEMPAAAAAPAEPEPAHNRRFVDATSAEIAKRNGLAAAQGFPTRKADLPTTVEGFRVLAMRIMALPPDRRPTLYGEPIKVFNPKTIANPRANFAQRMGLK